MHQFELALIAIIGSFLLVQTVSAGWNFLGPNLEPELQQLEGEQRDYVIEQKRNIKHLENELTKIEKQLSKDPGDDSAKWDREYVLDKLASEEGKLNHIQNKINSGEPVAWDNLYEIEPSRNFKYLSYLNEIKLIEAGVRKGDREKLKIKINMEMEDRRRWRDSLRSGEPWEFTNRS